jgi:hypothetical protein
MPKRLSITIAGAVSLGSYEAGVLYEIIEAIRQHNATAADVDKIFVDVLTGASAGGMTAAIVAQKLLFEGGSLQGAYSNSLYRPWVQDITLDGLLNLQPAEDPTHSILSSNVVEAISKRYLTQRYQSHLSAPVVAHGAGADKISLGLALSNLNGIDYDYDVRPSGKFIYTRHQDELKIVFDRKNAASDSMQCWEPIRNAAVSTGAFPFAFRLKDLVRTEQEYKDSHLINWIAPVETFSYTDGGVFQNEPLGLAKELVDDIDRHLDNENRFYLFVAPGARGSTKVANFNEATANLRNTAQRLLGAVFEQARFHDWIMAEEVNSEIQLFDERAIGLKNCLLKERSEPSYINFRDLTPAAQTLNSVLYPKANELDAAKERLKKQFAKDYAEIQNRIDADAAEIWLNSITAFEAAAGLQMQDQMTIYGVTAAPEELASSGVSAFAGFFDQRLRDHDYDVGRTKARQFLLNEQLNQPGQIGKIGYANPDPIREIDESLNGMTLERMPRDVRQRFKDRLTQRAHELLKEIGVPTGIVREGIDLALISPFLNRLLYL